MANVIQHTAEGNFILQARGNVMTLRPKGSGWEMYTVNAAVRAWNRGFAIPKYFASLADVEKRYKSWNGIAVLVGLQSEQ